MPDWTSNGKEAKPWEIVAVRADLDTDGGMPEDVDHVKTRGAHPELKHDVTNLRPKSRAHHIQRHS